MSECPETDVIVTIGDALNWRVEEGLRHLRVCEECNARIELLPLTRAALTSIEPVVDAVLDNVCDALRAAARAERNRERRAGRWTAAVETALSGTTAVIIVISSGIEIGNVAAGVSVFAFAAGLLHLGRAVSSRLEAMAAP